MYKFVMTLAVFVGLATVSNAAHAANPYSDCGIGAAIFPNNPALAASSNAIWDLGSTAVTSATASEETCTNVQNNTASFILETMPQLETELALGAGEHLDALAGLLQCESPSAVIFASQKYEDFIATVEYLTASDVEKASALYNSLKTAKVDSCQIAL